MNDMPDPYNKIAKIVLGAEGDFLAIDFYGGFIATVPISTVVLLRNKYSIALDDSSWVIVRDEVRNQHKNYVPRYSKDRIPFELRIREYLCRN